MKRLVIITLLLYMIVPITWLPIKDPQLTNTMANRQPPNADYLLGTDHLGRDVLSRLIYGGQHTLRIAGLATLVATSIGLIWGLGIYILPQFIRPLFYYSLDAFLAIPGLLFALLVLTLLGQSDFSLALAVGISQIAAVARVSHSLAQQTYHQEFITAAHALGASSWHITRHHIMPNIFRPFIAYAGIVFAYSILNSAGLSFLGVGVAPGTPDWGVMLAEGRYAFRAAPWVAFYAGLAISITVWSINWLADNWQKHR